MKKVNKSKPRTVSIRMPIELFNYVYDRAKKENRSISQQVITIIQEQQK